MRDQTLDKIDNLHTRIKELIDAEKHHHDSRHPKDNWLLRQIAHTRIEMYRLCPGDRANMVEASARFPVIGGATASKPQGEGEQ